VRRIAASYAAPVALAEKLLLAGWLPRALVRRAMTTT
jgi:hypothetical protein